MKQIIVIGGGAAGLMAAVIAGREGARVILLEKMNMVGKKMGITGKGRCNITNNADMVEFIKNTPGNGKFLYSAYEHFSNEDLLELLHSWGLKTKVERGGRVFPESDSALDVRDTFMKVLKKYHVQVRLNEPVREITVQDGRVIGVRTDKERYACDAAILCTGGASYPLTGSTGDGYILAEQIGHTVTDIRPSLVPIVTDETWVKDIMGLSLRNVEVSVISKNKIQAKQFGEMMFTHFGITGPTILSLSHTVGKLLRKKDPQISIEINLKPALTPDVLDKRVQKDFDLYSKKQLTNGMKDLLPQNLIPVVIRLAELDPAKPVNQITRDERQRLCHVLQHMTLTVKGLRPVEEAIVTAGGLSLKEFNPKTMESKLIQGLYGAGEVLDIDAFTGGYNLQAAFSTGYVAAMHAVHGDEE
ncbi:aminoacetone oxidase family FAD-binding enzyme [Veillonella denticariosi JCM 15641]|uniref:Aminoacetone oxidase family FAD-binding enzyme n=1 Tax=Veillonella denticariosi JCM 15641 TaxID=1298594 RepID=A0A2S7Z753_9FIRM|nr:NAD(P)/FAD-dependent oxidoreductase [Veillonella denticariosi]PQL19025.1 aminoacetone oxidase family FAD-binding enzyme [Veillonella denticariosi JCM 15641]